MKAVLLLVSCAAMVVSCRRAEPALDWSARPLIESRQTLEDVTFSLTVPEGLSAGRAGSTVTFSAARGPRAPDIRVRLVASAPPRTVGEAVEQALAAESAAGATVTGAGGPGQSPATLVLRKEGIRRGQLVVLASEDQRVVVAFAYRALRDGRGKAIAGRRLECRASLDVPDSAGQPGKAETGTPSFTTLTSWLANICLTLSPDDLPARIP